MLEQIIKNAVKDFFVSNTKDYFSRINQIIKSNGLYPDINTITGPSSSPHIQFNGRKYVTFASNNYLSFAEDEPHKSAVIKAVEQYGVGSGSTRLLSGTLDIQVAFEKHLADFLHFGDSITFSSGFLANVGVIRMLVDPFPYTPLLSHNKGEIILSDALNHASIIDGVRLSKAERETYEHNDMDHLERLLKKHSSKRKLILTDSVFSMDGDFANLPAITKLAKTHDAILMVDDSHGVGVLGPNGEGAAHHFGVQGDVDVLMGSFTKAFGSLGGYIATSKEIADYLRMTARSYIFSDPIPPSLVAGLDQVLSDIKNGEERRKKTLRNAEQLRNGLKGLGFTVLGQIVPIVPLLVPSEEKVIAFSKRLLEKGFLAPAIRRPAVEEGTERIRFSLMASHEARDIEALIEECGAIGKELGLI